MANCNSLFQQFREKIAPNPTQLDQLLGSRSNVEDKIIEYFRKKEGFKIPSFKLHGSTIPEFRTIILKKDGTYDVDRGVYFEQDVKFAAETVQSYVKEAVMNITVDQAEHRKKCIRVLYRNQYNVDIPVFKKVPGDLYPKLAVKGEGWRNEDVDGLKSWLLAQKAKSNDGQLIHLIMYMKRWANEIEVAERHKMPSGIALTVWACENFRPIANRDDIAFCETLKSLVSSLFTGVSCRLPKEPFDNLVLNLDNMQRSKFFDSLKALRDDAERALTTPNQLLSSKLWAKHLGDKFPQGKNENI